MPLAPMHLPPLPFDMGNAGDLLKHGLLAEFTQWWYTWNTDNPMRFLDPFAGRKWVTPPNPVVSQRVLALPTCALKNAQYDPHRYFGSSYVVYNSPADSNPTPEVLVADNDPAALHVLLDGTPFQQIAFQGFNIVDSFSILNAKFQGDLLLLDPFGNFLPRAVRPDNDIFENIAIASNEIACVLFVLNLDPDNRVGQRYAELRVEHLPHAWSLSCPPLYNTGVRGESRYFVDVLLAWHPLIDHPQRSILSERLQSYANALTEVLQTPISFSEEF